MIHISPFTDTLMRSALRPLDSANSGSTALIQGSFPLIASWWPESITQPQTVGSAYWQLAGLGIELAGFGLLATLLVVSLTGTPRPRQDRFRS